MSYKAYINIAMSEMQKEVARHPELVKKFKDDPDIKTFEDALAVLAAEVELVLHGEYCAEDVDGICNQITDRLARRRLKQRIVVIDSGRLLGRKPDTIIVDDCVGEPDKGE